MLKYTLTLSFLSLKAHFNRVSTLPLPLASIYASAASSSSQSHQCSFFYYSPVLFWIFFSFFKKKKENIISLAVSVSSQPRKRLELIQPNDFICLYFCSLETTWAGLYLNLIYSTWQFLHDSRAKNSCMIPGLKSSSRRVKGFDISVKCAHS